MLVGRAVATRAVVSQSEPRPTCSPLRLPFGPLASAISWRSGAAGQLRVPSCHEGRRKHAATSSAGSLQCVSLSRPRRQLMCVCVASSVLWRESLHGVMHFLDCLSVPAAASGIQPSGSIRHARAAGGVPARRGTLVREVNRRTVSVPLFESGGPQRACTHFGGRRNQADSVSHEGFMSVILQQVECTAAQRLASEHSPEQCACECYCAGLAGSSSGHRVCVL